MELTVLLSVASVSGALYFGLSNKRRNDRQDITTNAEMNATIITKLDNLSELQRETKKDVKEIRGEISEMTISLAKVESSTDSAHHRLNDLIAGRLKV